MSEIVREMTREELVDVNNKLRSENEKLKAELEEARLAVEHNRHVKEKTYMSLAEMGDALSQLRGNLVADSVDGCLHGIMTP